MALLDPGLTSVLSVGSNVVTMSMLLTGTGHGPAGGSSFYTLGFRSEGRGDVLGPLSYLTVVAWHYLMLGCWFYRALSGGTTAGAASVHRLGTLGLSPEPEYPVPAEDRMYLSPYAIDLLAEALRQQPSQGWVGHWRWQKAAGEGLGALAVPSPHPQFLGPGTPGGQNGEPSAVVMKTGQQGSLQALVPLTAGHWELGEIP